MPDPLLAVEGLEVRHGRVTAVRALDLFVQPGEVVAVLGSNGAGKSSLLGAILGMYRPSRGRIVYSGSDITKVPVPDRVKRGLALVPEGRRILASLTVEENLLVGAHGRRDTDAVRQDIADIYRRFPNLAERRASAAGNLSGGEQQMLAVGRALLSKPRLMMLDEPSLGLSPLLVDQLFDLLRDLNERQELALLLVEQNTGKALDLADRAYVLDLGRATASGAASDLRDGHELERAYLG